MNNNPTKRDEGKKKRKGKRTAATGSGSSTGSSGSSNGANGPNEAELKLLRARFRNKFNAFATGFRQSDVPNQKGNVVRVPPRKKPAKSPIFQVSPPVEDGMTPTVFERISGIVRPAKTRLRRRDIFKKKVLLEAKTPDREKTSSSKTSEESSGRRQSDSEGSEAGKKKGTESEAKTRKAEKAKKKAKKAVAETKQQASSPLPLDTTPPVSPKPKKVDDDDMVTARKIPSTITPTPRAVEESDEKTAKPIRSTTTAAPEASANLYGDVPTAQPDAAKPEPPSPAKPTDAAGAYLGEYKGKKSLFDSMDEEIVLDDKVLQEIANDIDKGVKYNPELVDQNLASKLVEIKKKQANVTDAELQELTEQPYEVDETANHVVEALTSQNVLGQVLDADELKLLSEYFSGTRPQDEKVLQVLNNALEKILDRAGEFYADEKELKSFMENRDQAKVRLLDALLSRKSSFLSGLYSNAFYYANYLRDKMANAYQAAAHTYKVANVVAETSVAAASDAVAYSKDALERSAAVASDAVVYSKDALERSALVAKEMAQKGHELVTTARDDVTQRVAVAREVGQGLLESASAAALVARSWTSSISSSGTSTPRSIASPAVSMTDVAASKKLQEAKVEAAVVDDGAKKVEKVEEHWLTTVWTILSRVALLPYAFFESIEEPLDAARSDKSDSQNLRSSSIIVYTKHK